MAAPVRDGAQGRSPVVYDSLCRTEQNRRGVAALPKMARPEGKQQVMGTKRRIHTHTHTPTHTLMYV